MLPLALHPRGGSPGSRTPLCRETTGRPADKRENQTWLRERESNSPWLAYETCLITGSPATKTLHAVKREPTVSGCSCGRKIRNEPSYNRRGDYCVQSGLLPVASRCHMNGVAWLRLDGMTGIIYRACSLFVERFI